MIYELLALIEFTSARKRMSVLVKSKEGKILLLSKGADSVIMARLADDQKDPKIKAQKMIDEVSFEQITMDDCIDYDSSLQEKDFARWHLE